MSESGVLTLKPWKDYSQKHSATITLSRTHGNQFQTFTAGFISSLVGAAAWFIVAYVIFQVRANSSRRTIVHHQIQVSLRNSGSPWGTIWHCFQLQKAWRKNLPGRQFWTTLLACVVISLLASVIGGGFIALGIFSSMISTSIEDHILVRSRLCGKWEINQNNLLYLSNYQSVAQNRTIVADNYASLCYHSKIPDPSCNQFVSRSLPWTADYNATCPFSSGTCQFGDTAAFSMTTDTVDSHLSLGFNAPPQQRITFRRRTTCAPLHTRNYAFMVDGQLPGEQIQMFFYGNVTDGSVTSNTYNISTYAAASGAGYLLLTVNSYAEVANSNFSNPFVPAPDFKRTDADVNFFFLAPVDISFIGTCDDPFFSAHYEPYSVPAAPGILFYRPDFYSTVLGCTDQYEICNPATETVQPVCTPFVGLASLLNEIQNLGLSSKQSSTADVLLWILKETGMSFSVAGRGAAALRAQRTVYSNRQAPLPNNQWTIEAAGWYDTALAKLQFAILEFGKGPSAAYRQLMESTPPFEPSTCDVKLRSTAYTNLSVLGIAIVFSVGLFLVVLSWCIDTLVGKLQTRTGWGKARNMRWVLDEKLQLLRQLYEEILPRDMEEQNGYGWTNIGGAYPVLRGQQAMVDATEDAPRGAIRAGKSWPRYSSQHAILGLESGENSESGEKTGLSHTTH